MPKDKGSRKISLQTADDILRCDLETLRQEAIELGVSMAEVIPAEWVEIDERVRLKCSVPLCPQYDKNLYCLPRGASLDLMRKAISRYTWALPFAPDVIPPEEFADRSIEREAVLKWGGNASRSQAGLRRSHSARATTLQWDLDKPAV